MAQAKIAAPIDRPLSRAYLRGFKGWSTAFPPGMSDPTSLRVMRNCNIDPDGSVSIRPGLRRIFNNRIGSGNIIGSFEHFYFMNGDQQITKALLFAVDNLDGTAKFKVAYETEEGYTVIDATAIFTTDPGTNLSFGVDNADLPKYITYVQIDNKILALSDTEEAFRLFDVSSNMKAYVVKSVERPQYTAADKLLLVYPNMMWINGPQTSNPLGQNAPIDNESLIALLDVDNIYSFGYFYTFNNMIGESAPSMVMTTKTRRRWTTWKSRADDMDRSPDQIVTIIPEAVWNDAVAAGAVSWNLYMMTWSDQDSVPVEGVLIKTTDMVGKTYQQAGWAAHTPLVQGSLGSMAIPSISGRENFSTPSRAGNGVVAGDRLILVYDLLNRSQIKWSSNLQGDYLNFSASKGGGYKTLTSGNLYMPVTVKLWQNPQSVDTLVILCKGVDGSGTAYYMSPNSTVTAQNQANLVMGFEETTATPGTVSPYGCEVLNNALYHPLENNLMKSTASNYNINHALMADDIQNMWQNISLDAKERIVSSQMDSILYYLVKAPQTWDELPHHTTQIWTCNTSIEGAWSCWNVEASSLKKLDYKGQLYMAVCSGPDIFILDPEFDHDDEWDPVQNKWVEKGIPWEIETNTQGANRAHDAWAMVQQVNVTFGNFTGECVYGIRGKDVNGQMVEVSKHYVSPVRREGPFDKFDLDDFLLVRRIMKEWVFFWRSAPRPKNRSHGSVNFVQYRYTPASVNVGYENGSIETFEYGQRIGGFSNGVDLPFAVVEKP